MFDLAPYIRNIPDFPKPGVQFKDITPMLQSPEAFRAAVDQLAVRFAGVDIDVVCAAEARGFLFAGGLAYKMGWSLVPMRKPGKLPFGTRASTYSLEYGTASLHVHVDAFKPGQRVLLVDDLLATGGTATAMARLVREGGAVPVGVACVVELVNLPGRENLPPDLIVESLLGLEG